MIGYKTYTEFSTSDECVQNNTFLLPSFAFQFFYSSFLIIFFLFPQILFSESYSGHRFDDKNYFLGGGKSLVNAGRIESTIPVKTDRSNEEEQSDSKNEIGTKQYFSPKFYSQKGGDKEDLAGRYANQVTYSPEIFGYRKTNESKYMLLFSPMASYREDFILKRNVNRLVDIEFIAEGKWDKNHYSINLEGGRGFQRLDGYGILFNGMANYGETNFYWKPLGLKFSLLGLSYNYNQTNFTMHTNDPDDKIFGGNILFQSLPYISHFHIFNYQVLEQGQIAEKQYFQEDKKFKPKGKFNYRGFEFKTKDILQQMKLELGFFSVTGYRDYAEYSYQAFNNISKTNGFLSYLVLNFLFDKWLLRTGGLYATKDKPTRSSSLSPLARGDNGGYSTLLSDVRIFGGKSSFLLMETVYASNGTIFREFDSTSKNSYDTKGMELVSIGLSYYFTKSMQITGIFNHVNSNLGIGNEGILSTMYIFPNSNPTYSSFFLLSVCVAKVNPVTQKKILYDEIRVDPAIKEFTRFYLSGGISF